MQQGKVEKHGTDSLGRPYTRLVNVECGYTKKLRVDLKDNLKSRLGLHKNLKTGIEANLSGTSIGKLGSDKAINKSKENGFSVAEHFEMANQIVGLFENAPYMIPQNDNKNHDDNIKIERFVSKDVTLKSGKKARAYITVKHTLNTDGRLIYSIEAMDIKNALVKTRAVSGQQLGNNPTSPSAFSTIPQSVKKSTLWCYFKKDAGGNLRFYIKKSVFASYRQVTGKQN